MKILGISAYYHDSAACLVEDGVIRAAAQEERFSRKKHDPSFPVHAVQFCLKEGGLQPRDLDYVVFYDKPFVKFERIVESYLQYAPRGLRSFVKAIPLWVKEKLWIKEHIRQQLGGYEGPVLWGEHHASHAASAFYPSPFEAAAILTADGVGEWATASFGVGRGNQIELWKEIHFPHSLGLLYSAFTYYVGFKVNSGEYKLMGLAPYGEPKYKDKIYSELVDVKEDGSFQINMRYFDYGAGLCMINRRFEKLFGGPSRKPESKLTQKDMDIARSIQEVTEEIMLKMARYVHRQTGMRNLCLAGGVALNCVANARILREGPFEQLWIQPAAGDAGGALGAALLVWHTYLERPRTVLGTKDRMQGAYLGPAYSDEEIRHFLEERRIPATRLPETEIPDRIADLIHMGKVIGWFQGRMEFGPRALGSRSILGDARSPVMQEMMNLKIKFRESFRPFAPSVLLEKTSEYFDFQGESPYMQLVAEVRAEKRKPLSPEEERFKGLAKLRLIRSDIPAVTHVDYSARLQTVSEQTNPLYYRLIRRFDEKYGCPVIINTSFNVRGEPIVCTPEDAYQCFMHTNMDYLIMGPYLIEKKEQEPLDKDIEWLREYDLD